jgi:hypothetical protein
LVLTSARVFHTIQMLCGFTCEGDANRFGQFTKKAAPAFIVVADPDYVLSLS